MSADPVKTALKFTRIRIGIWWARTELFDTYHRKEWEKRYLPGFTKTVRAAYKRTRKNDASRRRRAT